MMAYLDERGVGWVACWYDDQSEPPMFPPGRDGYTGFGQFVLSRLGQSPSSD